MPIFRSIADRLPGLGLCLAVTAAAIGAERIEIALTGRAWLESLVLAILIGMAIRSTWTPGPMWRSGVTLSAKTLLEIAVFLLGARVSFGTILAVGPGLLVGIVGLVAAVILVSYGLGRAFGLGAKPAILVACGNSICGNSAIAAVAPVIGADARDVASSIAFTAVLGVIVVLTLPLTIDRIGLSEHEYGVLAGMTVYAVPQVLAATVPVGAAAAQIGTLVKLVRVLMLGPVVLTLSLLTARGRSGAVKLPIRKLVPEFIIGFLALAALRSADLIPEAILPAIDETTTVLTIVSMAALGLGVDARSVARAGGRVTATVTLSILILGGAATGMIFALRGG